MHGESFRARRILLQMSTVFPVRFAWYLLAAAAVGVLLYLVAPIRTPFLLSAVLAYICLPAVDRIVRKLPRWLAAATVMALLVALRHLRSQYLDSDLHKSR
jgi:predicted PurR-regulated permease PerM